MTDILNWFQNWFYEQCDGDWEHNTNVCIKNLDNPGWKIEINLLETEFEKNKLKRIFIERTEHDWISYKIEDHKFKIACGPLNLKESLLIFKTWVEEHYKDTSTTST